MNPTQVSSRKMLRRTAIASAAGALCLTAAFAQTASDDRAQQCRTDARGRMNDACRADPRAVEINGVDTIPQTSERELPKITHVLGDERALRETRSERVEAAPPGAGRMSAAGTPNFASGADLLSGEDRRSLDELAAKVRGRQGLRFEIVGHTDTQPISPALRSRFADNEALGLARARATGRYLGERLGLPESAFVASSRGFTQPVATPAQDPANWPANRRVEVQVFWQEAAAPRRTEVVTRTDPTECRMLTPLAEATGPMRISIDGRPEGEASSESSADRQRCVDVGLERNGLRLQYDNLSQPRRLSAAAWPTIAVPGERIRFAGYSNYLLFLAQGRAAPLHRQRRAPGHAARDRAARCRPARRMDGAA